MTEAFADIRPSRIADRDTLAARLYVEKMTSAELSRLVNQVF